MKYKGILRNSRILTCLGVSLAVPLILGASGGNCGGVEAGNVVSIRGENGQVLEFSVTNTYPGSVSLGTSAFVNANIGRIASMETRNLDPRYVPYLMSVDLDVGGMIEDRGCSVSDPNCRPFGTFASTAALRDQTLSSDSGLDDWNPEKYTSVRVYDFGECRANGALRLDSSALAYGYALGFQTGLRESYVYPEARVRFLDVRPFFRGPQARFAELIVTPQNYNQLFVETGYGHLNTAAGPSNGTARRLRNLREIPRQYFRDNHHPMDGDYLQLTADFEAPEMFAPVDRTVFDICLDCDDPHVTLTAEVDVIVINWDAMATDAGFVLLNSVQGTVYPPDECNINHNGPLYNGSAGDWVAWYRGNTSISGRALSEEWVVRPEILGDSTQIRRLYVDSSNVQVRATSNCGNVIVDPQLEDGLRNAYSYNLGNQMMRRVLEERMAVQPTGLIPVATPCRNDADCTYAAEHSNCATCPGGVLPNRQNFICQGAVETSLGVCMVLPQLDRIMMTPESIVMVTSDYPGSLYSELMSPQQCADDVAEAPDGGPIGNVRVARTGQIGNPGVISTSGGPRTSGFSRYVAPSRTDAGQLDPSIVAELARCATQSCFYDPNLPIRPPL